MVAPEESDHGDANMAIVPVGEVQSSSLPAPDLSDIKAVASHTKSLGIILPPPDIRAIVDKTAQFVARNGIDFEKRILANESNNSKFNFLHPNDPYHPFYRMRVDEYGKAEKGEEPGDAETPAAPAPTPAVPPPVIAAPPPVVPAPTLEKPDDAIYLVDVPEGLTALDLDIIKLTAQFVARNGKSFLTGLASREQQNPVFSFLKPTHSMFTFFTRLCDAYSATLMPEKKTKTRFTSDSQDRTIILERCLKRLEWEKAKEREAKEAADELERERQAMSSIDWHDFTVVVTIDFFADEEDLPPPLTLKDVIAMNKARDYEEEDLEVEEEGAANGDKQQQVEMDEDERAMVAEAAAAAAGTAPGPPAPPQAAPPVPLPPMPAAPPVPLPPPMPPSADTAPNVDIPPPPEPPPLPDDTDDQPIRIVKNYKRQDPRQAGYDTSKFVVSPITGELVPIEEMAEHMRISLIDPKWREQKEAMLSKIRETTKADDSEITRNLVGLARTRPDIFGSTEEEVTQAVTAGIKEKQTTGTGRPVVWDGAALGQQPAAVMKNLQDSRADILKQQEAHKAPQAPILRPGPPPPTRPVSVTAAVLTPSTRPAMPPPVGPPPTHHPQPLSTMRTIHTPSSMPGPPGMPSHGYPPMPPPMPPGARMPPPPMPPGAGGHGPPPVPEDEPAEKRARTGEFVLQPEEEFLQLYPPGQPSKVRVQCPEVDGNDKLFGQLLEVEVATLVDSVGDFKSRLADVIGVPANKQKLAREGVGFLRDEFSLSYYNVSPEVVLTLGVKERGGRKK